MQSLRHILGQNNFFNRVISDLDDPDNWLISPNQNISNATGKRVNEKSAIKFSAVYRAVCLLSDAIAGVPKHIFKTDQDGITKQKAKSHPVWDIIKYKPNTFQTTYEFFEMLGWHYNLWGEFYAEIRRRSGFGTYAAKELIPHHPTKINTVLRNGDIIHKTDEGRVIPDGDMIHVMNKTHDGVNAISPVSLHRQSIGIALAAEEFQAAFYGRGTHTGGVLVLPEGIDLGDTDAEVEEYITQLRSSFDSTYAGPQSFHKTMILEPGMEFKPFEMPLKDAEFMASKEFQIGEAGRIYGVPLHKLMDLDNATLDNIEQQGIDFVQDGVLPIVSKVEAELNIKLLTSRERETHYFKFNLAGLMRADLKSRYEAYSVALGKNAPGFMTVPEIRLLEDKNPTPALGELKQPKNMVNQQNSESKSEEEEE